MLDLIEDKKSLQVATTAVWSTPSAMAGMRLLDDEVHGISSSVLAGALISILPLCVAGVTEFKLCKCS